MHNEYQKTIIICFFFKLNFFMITFFTPVIFVELIIMAVVNNNMI